MEIKTTKDLDPYKYWETLQGRFSGDVLVAMYEYYIDFVHEQLCISMFVPCKEVDGKMVPLEKPSGYNEWINENNYPGTALFISCKEYQEAEKNVLFNIIGVEFKENEIWIPTKNENEWYVLDLNSTIKDLIDLEIPLTQNAKDKLT